MKIRIKTALHYIKAAPWPYMTGLLSLLLAKGLGVAGLANWADGDHADAIVFGCWAGGWIVVAFFAMADGVSRYREYKRIKAMFARYGYNERILAPVARSRCQRDAAMLAAREAGWGRRARRYFADLGYRWYHILPDSVVRNPLVFLRPSFLRMSFLPGKKARI